MPRKAIALISGGLDSMLAARLMQEQGITVEGVNFYTGFCVEGHTHAIRQRDGIRRNNALWVAEQLDIPLHIIDVSEEYHDVVLNPRHGYGSELNPCLDCKIFMVRKTNLLLKGASELADAQEADFIVTGEVIGQRMKSQLKRTMPLIARESGADDRLLRPLCAKLLEPTLPEREGWVDRERLFAFNGRSRQPQIELAKSLGLKDWAQPAGGCCFLTDASYSRKLRDLWQSRGRREYSLDDILLLKVGRHLRPQPHYKVIISREEGENFFLEGYRKRFLHVRVLSHAGPLALVEGDLHSEDRYVIASLVARYSQGRDAAWVRVGLFDLQGQVEEMLVKPLAAEAIPESWHVGG
ncbi:MAG: tRNA (5-methylaminomethyl-2-thiouridylate)-methyltransferase [Pseudomonadales bacterium]|nr:tRNA (5-methylaminomethyl-2-thiouridylate)-methyltransferase [Pseudomonadales bacterium]